MKNLENWKSGSMRFDRCRILFKEEFEKLENAKILLIGAGGVGGFCLDCLYRTGITNIVVVDFDIFETTNQNRQIGSDNIGKKKTKVLSALYPKISTIEKKIDKKWIAEFDFSPYDIVIDAIDEIEAKVELAKKIYPKLISSMGSARKSDPTKIEIASIWKTHGDPLSKKIRKKLKQENFCGDFITIFSPQKSLCKELGSFVGVTGAFGLTLCYAAIEKIKTLS